MEQKELIDYVCETVLKPLSEERGRIPFIEKILNELETQLTEQMDSSKHGYYLDKFVFKPTQDTFFNNLCFLKGSEIVIDNEIQYPEVYGYVNLPQIRYTEKEDKIDVLPMLITIKTNQKNFSFAFRSLVAHELLHAYECFKRKANRVNFRPDNGFYNRVMALSENESDIFQCCIGHFLYYAVPQEKRAISQEIQSYYMDNQALFGKRYRRYPFEQIKSNIPFFQHLYETFDKLNELLKGNPQKCILIFNYAFGLDDTTATKPIKTERACRKLIENIKFDLEQTYNKALCRAIEDEWLHRQDLAF